MGLKRRLAAMLAFRGPVADARTGAGAAADSPGPVTPLDALAAAEEIKRLKARYFRAVDAKNWPALRAVLSDDAVFHRSDLRRAETDPVYETIGGAKGGADRIVDWISERLGDAVSIHRGFMPDIEILSATTARGIWSMEDEVDWPGGAIRGSGHYHETYVRVAGQWRISSFKLIRQRVDARPAGEARTPSA